MGRVGRVLIVMDTASVGDGLFCFYTVVEYDTVIAGFGLLVAVGKTGISRLDISSRADRCIRCRTHRKKPDILQITDTCAAQMSVRERGYDAVGIMIT